MYVLSNIIYGKTSIQNKIFHNLVDPASSYTFVSKIKPCKSKYEFLQTKLRTAHYNSDNLYKDHYYTDICGNSGANTCINTNSNVGSTYQLSINLLYAVIGDP